MNNIQPSSKKPIIIVVAVAILAGIIYFYYTGGTAPEGVTLLQAQPNAAAEAAGARVLALSNQIKNLRLDTTVFRNPVYLTLQDFTVEIPPDNVGRSNPFAPIPGFVPTGGGTNR